MNRRDFGRLTAGAATAALVAPTAIAATAVKITPQLSSWDERKWLQENGWSDEQLDAYDRMEAFEKRVHGIYLLVRNEFPQVVPDATPKKSWRHGSHRAVGRIAWWSRDLSYAYSIPSGKNLSRISCACLWRQAVRNRWTGEVQGFCSWGGILPEDTQPVTPGQAVTIHHVVTIDMTDREIADFARMSMASLQESVVEYREARA